MAGFAYQMPECGRVLHEEGLARLERQKRGKLWPVMRVVRGLRRRLGPMPKGHYTFNGEDW